MKLPYKIKRLYNKKPLLVRNSFIYVDSGIVSLGENRLVYGKYVSSPLLGTGFYTHTTESSSYNDFINRQQKKIKPSIWKTLFGNEFSFDDEIKKADKALEQSSHPLRSRILETYRNSLVVAHDAVEVSKIVEALRRDVHKYHRRKVSSLQKHYKQMLHNLEHQIRSMQFKLNEYYSPEQMQQFKEVTCLFNEVVACRRIWDAMAPGTDGHRNAQVYFDMGVFDYIDSEWGLPMLRDGHGLTYFILPDSILRVRSNTDFDIVPLSAVSLIFHVVGDNVQSEFNIPEMPLSYHFSSVSRVKSFVEALKQLQ